MTLYNPSEFKVISMYVLTCIITAHWVRFPSTCWQYHVDADVETVAEAATMLGANAVRLPACLLADICRRPPAAALARLMVLVDTDEKFLCDLNRNEMGIKRMDAIRTMHGSNCIKPPNPVAIRACYYMQKCQIFATLLPHITLCNTTEDPSPLII